MDYDLQRRAVRPMTKVQLATVEEMMRATRDKRHCIKCDEDKTLDYFSMQAGEALSYIRRDHGGGNISWDIRWTCNQCRIDGLGPQFRFQDPHWQDKGACRGQDVNIFMPETARALAERSWEPFCGDCPVRAACGAYGAATGSIGVWGGEFRTFERRGIGTTPAAKWCRRKLHWLESDADYKIRASGRRECRACTVLIAKERSEREREKRAAAYEPKTFPRLCRPGLHTLNSEADTFSGGKVKAGCSECRRERKRRALSRESEEERLLRYKRQAEKNRERRKRVNA